MVVRFERSDRSHSTRTVDIAVVLDVAIAADGIAVVIAVAMTISITMFYCQRHFYN